MSDANKPRLNLLVGTLVALCLGLALALTIVSVRLHQATQPDPPVKKGPTREELQARITRVRNRVAPADSESDALASCFHAQLDYMAWRVKNGAVERWLTDRLKELDEDLTAHAAGRHVFTGRRGAYLCGHWSRLDDTVQPFRVALPEDYDPSHTWPVIVVLHGQGMFRPYQGNARRTPGVITVAPHGRGGMDYKYVGEQDVMAVVDKVKALFPVDEDRVYLGGSSMGGTGSWHLATRFPDPFAAIVPVCGNTDIRVWAEIWHWRTPADSPQAWVRDFLRDDTGTIVYAGNLINIPVVAFQGEADPVVNRLHGDRMVEALKSAGHESVTYHSLPLVTHALGVDYAEIVLPFKRKAPPAHVYYRTAWLKYDGAAWLRIKGIQRRLAYATVEGRADEDALSVTTDNVSELLIQPDRAPLEGALKKLTLDGKRVTFDAGHELRFIRTDSTWSQALPSKQRAVFPPRKTAEIEGPLEHAFMSRFVIVRPALETDAAEAAAKAADHFASMWKHRFTVLPRVSDDVDVSTDDIADSNLILYGGPDENTLTARIMATLPVQLGADHVKLGDTAYTGDNAGVKLCFPNPLNLDRYVVLIAGCTPESYADINVRFGNWFDWIPYDYRSHFDYAVFDDRTVGRAPETFLVWGFFGEDWQLDERLRFEGVPAWREAARPRVLPSADEPSATTQVLHVDELAAERTWLGKEYLERKRSLDGGPLMLNGAVHERGLAYRFPGTVQFATAGRTRFKATVGIQWDGKTEPSEDRQLYERAVFAVKGAGKADLFRSDPLKYSDAPVEVDIDITGEKTIKLQVRGGRAWLCTTAVWANARLLNPQSEIRDPKSAAP